MPVWNGETYLREAVDSILNQTFRDFEFLILDDGSTDSTPQILAEYAGKDSRIRVIQLDHQGIVIALNRGVAEAQAAWIARMDCDDIAHPERFKIQMMTLERNPSAVLCFSDIDHFGEASEMHRKRHLATTSAMIKLRLCYSCPIIHPTVVFSKAAFFAAGGYHPDERHAEDFALWGRMLSHGNFVGVRKALLQLRVHYGSISKQKAEVQEHLSHEISIRHCQQFLKVSQSQAEQIWAVFRGHKGNDGLGKWLSLGIRLLIHLRPQSLELWAWFSSQTLRRAIYRLQQLRHRS
jgi:glycosyltransferase involved in cell wall biosynthesis